MNHQHQQARPTNPHLNESGLDPALNRVHCKCCEDALHNQNEILSDHVACSWIHYGKRTFEAVIATDERGKTIEGVERVPSRTIIAKIPMQLSVSYCLDCFPFVDKLQSYEDTTTCVSCDAPVDTDEDYSVFTFLARRVSGTGPLLQGVIHADCLPKEFDLVQSFRQGQG